MEGMNKGFKIASDKFEKVINSSEKILRSADKILEILLEGHHNIIVIIGAGTMAILIVLVLVLVIYMIKLAEHFKMKNKEADEKINEIKELKSSWGKLEVEIKSLVQEINQVKVRMQEASVVPHIYPSAPVEEPIGGFQRGQAFATSKRKIMPSLPSRSTEVYSFNME